MCVCACINVCACVRVCVRARAHTRAYERLRLCMEVIAFTNVRDCVYERESLYVYACD